MDPLRVSGDSKASVERGVRIDRNSAAAGLSCAEYAVSTRFDRAAGDGVPAHITVIYPFKSLELMTTADQRCLDEVAAMFNTISMRASRTGWFGDSVLYLAPDDPTPIALLTRHVWTAFPDFPPYGGKFAEAVPHLTIGHDHSLDELKAAERPIYDCPSSRS